MSSINVNINELNQYSEECMTQSNELRDCWDNIGLLIEKLGEDWNGESVVALINAYGEAKRQVENTINMLEAVSLEGKNLYQAYTKVESYIQDNIDIHG